MCDFFVKKSGFWAKMDIAFREIENGDFDSVDTIDELIDLLDGGEK